VPTLLAYPNVSDGRDRDAIAAIGKAFGPELLDVHSDPDHHRSAYTLAGRPGDLAPAVVRGAAQALRRLRLTGHDGAHPRVGVLDVAPIVYLSASDRGAACAEALVLADRLAIELELPVFLYGALAGGRTRAELRRGGPRELERRIADGELAPDFGPRALHPTAGATLVAARAPLLAFNLLLAPQATHEDARRAAAAVREGGADGLVGVRALGLWLDGRGRAQVSTNVDDAERVSAADVLAAVARHVPVDSGELVGLAPRAALEGFPDGVPLHGRATIEDALAAHRAIA
jgi:glutamate formiminotransferase